MKAGISNIWLLGMIAVFIFIFSTYVIISVNYTKSFKMKNEVLSIIERGKGMTGTQQKNTVSGWAMGKGDTSRIVPGAPIHKDPATFQAVNIYLLGSAYNAMGTCPEEPDINCWYGVTSLDKFDFDYPAQKGKKYYYCFSKFRKGASGDPINKYTRYYYKVRLFYKMEFISLLTFWSVRVDGKTAEIVDVQDVDSSGNSIVKVCYE